MLIEQEREFKSIADEEFRTYVFPEGETVTIQCPMKLNVSDSGGHRVVDSTGISHYIPSGWIHLFWKVREGAPFFRF
jgi:hypothetical protein